MKDRTKAFGLSGGRLRANQACLPACGCAGGRATSHDQAFGGELDKVLAEMNEALAG